MRSPNEFWLCLHELARAIDAEGGSDEERRAHIVATLEQMHPVARTQVVVELVELMTFLPDLYPQVIGLARNSRPAAETQSADPS
jgi:hypothetical protein